jgi:4-amino-4-deoxy-L-arabinose transferase-like glycosyltransferase
VWFLAIYFLLSLLIRVALGGGLELDESEQLLLTQKLRWGYGFQPPLYTWLQYGFFAAFGINIFSLALLKHILLFTVYFFIYLIANTAFSDHRIAQMAVLSLFLSPQLGWEFYRTQTHNVLATIMGACLIVIILSLRKTSTTVNYVFLGSVAGLGILSKYNLIPLLPALFLACLSRDEWRSIVVNRRISVSILAAIAVSAGHLWWVLGNLGTASGFTRRLGTSEIHLLTYAKGIFSLAFAAVGLFWPLLLVYMILFLKAPKVHAMNTWDPDVRRLLGRTILYILIICCAIILTTNATHFMDRWFNPLLFFLPIYLIPLFHDRISTRRYKIFISLTTTIMVFMLVLYPGRALLASKTGHAVRRNDPYRNLSTNIRQSGFNGGNILASDMVLGGNLRLDFLESTVNVPGCPEVPLQTGKPIIIIWNASKNGNPPVHFLEYALDMTGENADDLEPRFVEAPLIHFRERSMRLGYYLIE